MSSSPVCREPVRVVVINTQYVETDARSFKSVVQRLTGKDSNVAAWEQNSTKVMMSDKMAEATSNRHTALHELAGRNSVFTRDMSSKELDSLLREISSIDELLKFE